ncbi:hypothetical protein [Demequina sediminicola]|uniref:hypothetical protein n=1 Tax=Demequina sediminicola TaxID=1095026 RepID=UPI000785F00D|nr:hypothetical protein [Demequina sediminicola]
MSRASARGRIWPLSLAAREGLATARTGRWTSAIVVIATAWLIAAPAIADALGVTRLMEAEQDWIDAGGHVYVVTGATVDGDQLPIPTSTCESLASYEGVESSFALTRSGATGALASVPGGRASVYSVTSGALPFLGIEGDPRGVAILSSGFSERTGVLDGETIEVVRQASDSEPAARTGLVASRVANIAPMGDEFDGALLVPSLLGDTADACYVATDAARHEAVGEILPAALAYDGRSAAAADRLYTNEFTVDYTTAYEDRPLRWLWIASALALGLMWALVQWFRRSHTAIYATFGVRAPARLTMQLSEWVLLALAGAAGGWALGLVGALALGARTTPALSIVSAHTALTLIGATLIVITVALKPTGTLLNALKDR